MKFIEALLNFPTEKHVEKFCKLGEGEETCRYFSLAMGGSPRWSCEKTSSVKRLIDERIGQGTMNAKGDNCEGLLGLIMDNQKQLEGKRLEYSESMPSYRSSGVFKRMEIKSGILCLVWEEGGKKESNSLSVNDLGITVARQSITFDIAGLGSFAGRTIIFFN